MPEKRTPHPASPNRRPGPRAGVSELPQRLLQSANQDVPLSVFLREIEELLLDFSGCDAVELWLKREESCLRSEATRRPGRSFAVASRHRQSPVADVLLLYAKEDVVGTLCRLVVEKKCPPAASCFTRRGAFWTGDLRRTIQELVCSGALAVRAPRRTKPSFSSLAILPILTTAGMIGLLQLKGRRAGRFCQGHIECFEGLAQALGVALAIQLDHAALRERIKELTCLYRLAQLAERPEATLKAILEGIVELLPAAWQYPEIAAARIVLDGACYATANCGKSVHQQSAHVMVGGERRGSIEVAYVERRPELDEGPFLKEERSLINAVARQIGLIVERRHAAEEKVRLQEQLRHADRLATIGQLAAGVAHELNEPLGNILAFAQLAGKEPHLPAQAAEDLEKIVTASLHAREVVKKLMFFARRVPPQKTPVDLNDLIEEGLSFLESRCASSGVAVHRRLSRRLPRITADRAQLNQVLVNLVVNAIQAMPEGGTLAIATRPAGRHVVLSVADNGIGMDGEVLRKIFIPFFTTKDVHEGTGLGLPVVHGIVTSHGGTIAVRSAPGRGTRCEIRLPVANAAQDKECPGDETVAPA